MSEELDEVIGRLNELISALGRASYDGITGQMAKDMLTQQFNRIKELESSNRDLRIDSEDMRYELMGKDR